MLPVNISNSVFNEVDKLFSNFIWQGKRSRIKLRILKLSKTGGGLNVPNLKHYFWAAQLRPVIAWMQDLSETQWLGIEKSLCNMPLDALPFSNVSLKDVKLNEWTRTTLIIWRKMKQSLDLPKELSAQ